MRHLIGKKAWVAMAWAVAAMAGAAGFSQESGNTGAGGEGRGAGALQGNLPFALSVRLTGITGPLNADGSPDYLAAVNALYGQGTKPEDNLFVGWAEMTGAKNGFLKDAVREATLKMAEARVDDAREIAWTEYDLYLSDQKQLATEEHRRELQRMTTLHAQLWRDADAPRAAEYLTQMDKALDAMVALTARPKWWAPQVSTDGRSVLHADAPEVGQLFGRAMVLGARATRRMKSGDFAGFLRDAMAIRNMARLLSQGPTLLERGVAMEVEIVGLETMGAAVAAGNLTADQRAALRAAMARLPKLGRVDEAVDVVDRWQELDDVIIVATGKAAVLEVDELPAIDRQDVDWEQVLKDVNAGMDKRVAALHVATVQELVPNIDKTAEELQMQMQMRFMGPQVNERTLRKNPGETAAAYAQRIADWIFELPDEGPGLMQEEDERVAAMGEKMLDALLAAADYKEKNGKWPEVLSDLVPAHLPAVPKDIYSEFGRYDVEFDVLKMGVRISSMGRPGKTGLALGAGQ